LNKAAEGERGGEVRGGRGEGGDFLQGERGAEGERGV